MSPSHFSSESEPVLRDRAPGLTADLVDTLLKDAWVAGYWAGMNEGSENGRREGFEQGVQRSAYDVGGQVQNVIDGRLQHIARRLNDRQQREAKTTIADERTFSLKQGEEIWAAIRELEKITGGRAR